MPEVNHFEPERRQETRIEALFPLQVRFKNSKGQAMTSHSLADNLSSGGLYFQFPLSLPIGQHLLTVIQLPNGIRMAGRGRILRIEEKSNGLKGMAISFSRTRLIPAPNSKN